MPSPKGAVLTERDRQLIAYLGIARYASRPQLQRIVADGRHSSILFRRLRKLSTRGDRPGDDAYLRRLEYRRPAGTAVPVWALSSFGRATAEADVPYLRPPAAQDVAYQFLEHTLLLNEVLVGLVLALRPSPDAPLAQLQFRWLSEGDEELGFQALQRHTNLLVNAVLKPDAILEVPGHRRRLFIEAETGAHSITTANPAVHGAVLQKLQRYTQYFTALAGDGPATWYARAFEDGFFPVLVFLVHSADRRKRVEKAVAAAIGSQREGRFRVRVLTFGEAAPALASFIKDGKAASPLAQPPVLAQAPGLRTVALDERRARELRNSYNALAEAFNATTKAVAEHNAGCARRLVLPLPPLSELRTIRDLIRHDLLGEPRTPDKAPGVASR
jgi:protein involved in plasmid replication-relaxation